MATEAKKKAPSVEGVVLPDGAKVPQDRKAKATAAPEALTATVAGREWTVPAGALDDFELLGYLSDLEDGEVTRLPKILKLFLGDQYPDAMNAIRDKDTGRVSVEVGTDFVMELMGELNPNS